MAPPSAVSGGIATSQSAPRVLGSVSGIAPSSCALASGFRSLARARRFSYHRFSTRCAQFPSRGAPVSCQLFRFFGPGNIPSIS